jgi:hypothetical protein
MISSSNQTLRFGVMNLLRGNFPFFSILKIVLRASGTSLRTSTMSSMRRGPVFTSVISNTFALLSALPCREQIRARVCQQPAFQVKLVHRNAHHRALAFHQLAHALARSLAHQHGGGVGFMISKPGQRAIAASRRHGWYLLSFSRCGK